MAAGASCIQNPDLSEFWFSQQQLELERQLRGSKSLRLTPLLTAVLGFHTFRPLLGLSLLLGEEEQGPGAAGTFKVIPIPTFCPGSWEFTGPPASALGIFLSLSLCQEAGSKVSAGLVPRSPLP